MLRRVLVLLLSIAVAATRGAPVPTCYRYGAEYLLFTGSGATTTARCDADSTFDVLPFVDCSDCDGAELSCLRLHSTGRYAWISDGWPPALTTSQTCLQGFGMPAIGAPGCVNATKYGMIAYLQRVASGWTITVTAAQCSSVTAVASNITVERTATLPIAAPSPGPPPTPATDSPPPTARRPAAAARAR